MRNATAIFADDRRDLYNLHGFSPAIKAGPLIFISGVVGFVAPGKAAADTASEFDLAFREIERRLAAADATMADIIVIDSFHVTSDLVEDMRTFNEVRSKYLKAPFPAWTAVSVSALGMAGVRAEIRVTAYVPTPTA